MPGEAVIRVDFTKYKYVDLPAEDALRMLEKLKAKKNSGDIDEAMRYIRNFDEFYDYMRKKFKDYIVPPHRPDDYIRGTAVVDKLKLYIDNGEKRVVIVFDRRVDVEEIREVLEEMGYRVRVEKSF